MRQSLHFFGIPAKRLIRFEKARPHNSKSYPIMNQRFVLCIQRPNSRLGGALRNGWTVPCAFRALSSLMSKMPINNQTGVLPGFPFLKAAL